MTTKVTTFGSTHVQCENMSTDDLFGLFASLIQPLKELEWACQRQSRLEQERLNACSESHLSILAILSITLRRTFLLTIPFVIIFWVVLNLMHTGDGRTWFEIYDAWVGELFFVKSFFNLLTAKEGGLLYGIFVAIILLAFYGILVPCITVLLPILLVITIIQSFITAQMARKTIHEVKEESASLKLQIDKMRSNLSEPLSFVPYNYQNSTALEHFCTSYGNGRVHTLQEAIEAFEIDMYRKNVEDNQKKIHNKQLEIMKEIEYQGIKIDSMRDIIDKINHRTKRR